VTAALQVARLAEYARAETVATYLGPALSAQGPKKNVVTPKLHAIVVKFQSASWRSNMENQYEYELQLNTY